MCWPNRSIYYGSSIDFRCLTMIDPATSWFEMVELPKLQRETSGSKVTIKNTKEADMTFDKSSAQISNLVYKTWSSRYPRQCCYLIHDNGSKFKLHFWALCYSYGIKRKPTSVKEPTSECYNGTYSCSHATYSWNCYGQFSETQCHRRLSIRQNMLHFALPTIWYFKASPGTAIFGRDMLCSLIFRS